MAKEKRGTTTWRNLKWRLKRLSPSTESYIPVIFFFLGGGREGSITLKYIIMLILSKVLSVKT